MEYDGEGEGMGDGHAGDFVWSELPTDYSNSDDSSTPDSYSDGSDTDLYDNQLDGAMIEPISQLGKLGGGGVLGTEGDTDTMAWCVSPSFFLLLPRGLERTRLTHQSGQVPIPKRLRDGEGAR